MLRCGQNEIKIRSAHGSYKKVWISYSDLSNFVVGRSLADDMSGRPVAVIPGATSS